MTLKSVGAGLAPVFFALFVLALAAVPAVVSSGWVARNVPLDDASEYAAYLAILAVTWGALALVLVAL